MRIFLLFFNLVLFVSWGLCSEEEGKLQEALKALQPHTEGYTSVGRRIENKENVPVFENLPKSMGIQAAKSILTSDHSSFPNREIEDVYEAFGSCGDKGSWALTCRPTMRRLADCASKNDPIALLYLAHAFDDTKDATKGCGMTRKLYELAFQSLQRIATQTSDLKAAAKARFMIANDTKAPYYLMTDDEITSSAEFSLKYLKDLTTREAKLLTKLIHVRKRIDPIPSIDDFLHEEDLKQHPGVFLDALGFLDLNCGDQVKALEKAIQKYEHPAFIMQLAGIYRIYYERRQNLQDNEKNIKLLEKAGSLGQPLGYTQQVECIVRTLFGNFYFGEATESELEKCKELLEKAKALKMPDAFLNYAIYLEEVYNRTPKENIAERQRLYEAYVHNHKQAAQLGCLSSYNVLYQLLPSEDQFFVDYPDPYKERRRLFMQVMSSQ